MKVLYLDSAARLGGAERSLLDMMESLRAAAPDWHQLLRAGADGPLVHEARDLGVEAEALVMPTALAELGEFQFKDGGEARAAAQLLRALPATAAYLRRLRHAIVACQPAVIHSNSLKMHLLAAWALRAERAPALIWHFHDYIGGRRLTRWLLGKSKARCRAAIANSKSVAHDLDALALAPRPIHLLYNGVDLARFNPCGPTADLDALAGLTPAPAGVVRVGLVATMARWKGQEVFLRALAALPAQLPIRGYLIGGPIYQTSGSQYELAELRALAAGCGLVERVGFTGFVEDAAAAMRALDVVVHASTAAEPFGLVIAEAMACGRALVMSQSGGARELVECGRDALCHPPGDGHALAGAIRDLVLDPGLRTRLGHAARASACARFDRARLGPALDKIYRSALAAAG